jgi:hypothetical protein
LAALADGSLGGGELVRAMKEDEPDRCRRLIDALVAERLVVAEGDLHRLP